MGRPVTKWLGAIALALGSTLAMGCQGESRPVVPSAVRPMLMVAGGAGENGAYFNGRLYKWTFPSSKGSDQRELVFGCFRVGVDMIDRAQPRARLYALFLPGATMHACPDGSDKHDHILSAVPGSPGYATQFGLLEVWPGPNFDPSIVPIKSEADLFAAEQAGQVVIIDDEVALHAVVGGPSK